MAKIRSIFQSVCFVFLGLFCGGEEDRERSGETIERSGHPRVTLVDDDDLEMRAAIDYARRTIGRLIESLGEPEATHGGWAVKCILTEGDAREYIWLDRVRLQDDRFIGVVNNEPYRLTDIKRGDEAEVACEAVADWMFIDSGVLQGGYTIRLIRNRMTIRDRRAFDREVSFRIL